MMDRLRTLVKPGMQNANNAKTTEERVALANADTIAFVKGIRQLVSKMRNKKQETTRNNNGALF
jgi:hypothetical protein